MKTNAFRALALLALGLLFSASLRPAHAQLGVAAGLNFDNVKDISLTSGEANFENATGWHAGIFYDISAGPIAVRPGIFYRDLSTIDATIGGVFGSFDLNLIEVPIDVRFKLAATPFVKPYFTAGPVISIPTGDDDAAASDFIVSANAGLGLEVNLPGINLRLFPEIRYAFGISRFFKEDFQLLDQTFQSDESARLNTFMIRLGIGI